MLLSILIVDIDLVVPIDIGVQIKVKLYRLVLLYQVSCNNIKECGKSGLYRDLIQLAYPTLDFIQLDLKNGSSE